MKQKTLQEQYNLIKEGKGNAEIFMKTAKKQFPNLIYNAATLNETISNLKYNHIISENNLRMGLVVTDKNNNPDWFKIFNENIQEAKAEEKKPTKEVVDMETAGFDYKDTENIDNVFGEEFLKGYYTEMKDPKNSEKTVEELKELVAKNLAKDKLHYAKNGQFGIKGVGYETEVPGLGTPKEPKGKYKSSGYGDLKENKITADQLLNKPKTLILDKDYSIRGKYFKTGDRISVQYQFDDDDESFYMVKGYGVDEIKILYVPKKEIEDLLKNSSLLNELETRSVGPMVKPEGFQVGDKVKYKVAYNGKGFYGITNGGKIEGEYSKEEAQKKADEKNKFINEIKNNLYQISKSGPKSNPHYVLEKPDGSKQIDMMFDTYEDAEVYAKKKGWKTQKGLNENKETFSEYSNDALKDMIVNLSRYEGNEDEIQIIKTELKKRLLKKHGGKSDIGVKTNDLKENKDINKEKFLELHDDVKNWENNKSSFMKMYTMLTNMDIDDRDMGKAWDKADNETRKKMMNYVIGENKDINKEKFLENNKSLQEVKHKKNSTDSKLSEIEKNGKIATLEMQIQALEEIIESKSLRLTSITEDDDLSELMDGKKVRILQKEIKLLEKRKLKMEKIYEKMCGKIYRQQENKPISEDVLEENEMEDLAKELATAIEDKLEDKKDEISELVDPISILSTVLAGNTLINIISKYANKLFKKYNFGAGEEAAKKIYDFTHKLEEDFKKPIERIVGLFTKDDKTKKLVTNGLFALLLLSLGIKAGSEAFSAIEKSDAIAGSISGLKAALKGKDIKVVLKDMAL
jgi:hypothetical protein